MWQRLLWVKVVLLVLAAAGFVGGCQAAYYPGPPITRSFESRMEDGGVSGGLSIGPDNTFPLRTASLGFFGFATGCAVGAAWVQAAEVRARAVRHGPVGRRSEAADFELVEE